MDAMKAFTSFTVRTQLPTVLAPLQALANNLRWSWDDRARRLFRWVDSELWEQVGRDPVRLLATVSPTRLAELSSDPSFMAFLDEMHDDLNRYVDSPGWLQLRGETPLKSVAYFSPEFGISEALPQYSGGLGVLAGDHLKAASGLNIPLTGIGLFYRQGYFRQTFSHEGYQQESYPTLDPHLMALEIVKTTEGNELTVTVDLAGAAMHARVWKAKVGRINLYLLDADIDANDAETRAVTDRLYGGGEEKRIRQEILLGIGGVRVLQALGIPAQVFHTNEGHAGFLGLERIRQYMIGDGLSLPEAMEASRAGCVFTTHTPVPAGIDRFPRALMEKYFGKWAADVGISFDEFMNIGHEPGSGNDAPFNMAVMGLRLAGQANGVSKLHGAVSREMFANLWPGVPVNEVPIGAVTNGVHARTWTSNEMGELFQRYVLPEWPDAGPDRWERIHDCPDDVLWRVREETRSRLVSFVRQSLRTAAEGRGLTGADLSWTDRALDPSVLTIGFSRRFATYKRSTLLLSDPERLKALLLHPDRPMQFVFAGKAHPADALGKELIKQIIQFSLDPAIRHRIAFVENYDIGVARMLYQGSDVWLNNPRRPMEACGTSGEKATLNGSLNLSILDGWWDEMYQPATASNPSNGWAIPSATIGTDEEKDRAEATALFELLEREVAPLFYDRPESPAWTGSSQTIVPKRWVFRMKHSLATLGHDVQASRMVRDYTTNLYEPAARRADAVVGKGLDAAKALAAWKSHVGAAWAGVKVESVQGEGPEVADVDSTRIIRAHINLGVLNSSDVQVQLLHGSVGLNDELENPAVTIMSQDPNGSFAASLQSNKAGRYGYTVRVIPQHSSLGSWAEVGTFTVA
jgi:glycogen phosphorylase